jgi:uncharacterized protein DUF3606
MCDRRLYRKRREFDRKPDIGDTAFVLVAVGIVIFAVLSPRPHKTNQLTQSCGLTTFRARAPLPVCGATEAAPHSSNFGKGVNEMTDDKTKIGEPDRSRVSGSQDYEIQYLAEKHGLSTEQVKRLIARVGNDREKIEAAARQLSKAG